MSDGREYVGTRRALEGIRHDQALRRRRRKRLLGRFYQLPHRSAPYRQIGVRNGHCGRFFRTNRRISNDEGYRPLFRELHRSGIRLPEPVIPYRIPIIKKRVGRARFFMAKYHDFRALSPVFAFRYFPNFFTYSATSNFRTHPLRFIYRMTPKISRSNHGRSWSPATDHSTPT